MDYIDRNLTEKRRIHTYAVAEEASKLAQRYGEDVEKAELAALFHDFFRGISVEELNRYVREFSLSPAYFDNNNLAHGKIAAMVMERDYHITDQDIINAVSFHTTGRAGMSLLEKIIYLADAIEPNRVYPGVKELRELAMKDLDRACLQSLEKNIEYIRNRGIYLDEDTLKARDYLYKRMKISNKE